MATEPIIYTENTVCSNYSFASPPDQRRNNWVRLSNVNNTPVEFGRLAVEFVDSVVESQVATETAVILHYIRQDGSDNILGILPWFCSRRVLQIPRPYSCHRLW